MTVEVNVVVVAAARKSGMSVLRIGGRLSVSCCCPSSTIRRRICALMRMVGCGFVHHSTLEVCQQIKKHLMVRGCIVSLWRSRPLCCEQGVQ